MTSQHEGIVAHCIRSSLSQPGIVLLFTTILVVAAIWPLRNARVDALPDLSDVQVIVRAKYPGQTPQVVEDQVTFPLTTALLSVPGATTVRGYSLVGDAFIYVLFADNTDVFRARARVLERLNLVASRLPIDARVSLGPEATGVGWVYEYALVDRTGTKDIYQLRALQDWWLTFELQTIDGVAEVATIGGMVKEYQVIVDPDRLRARSIPLATVRQAIERGNGATGGSVVEIAEADYIIRANAYIRGVQDLEQIPLAAYANGGSVTIKDVADVRLGPQLRQGVADLNGDGEVVGGVIIGRQGADVRGVISAVKFRLNELSKSLPPGVEIVETYDRSSLIERTTQNLVEKLIEECLIVLAVCVLFLGRFRSGLVVAAVLPLGLIVALGVTQAFGVGANVMSLGGVAIAIGTMVDAAIVIVENVHKRLEGANTVTRTGGARDRIELVGAACLEVAPLLVVALLIIGLSFLPVLALEGQEGRLFSPLVYTKTVAVLAAACLSVTLVPVLILMLSSGPIHAERDNVVNRAAASIYRPLLALALRHPHGMLAAALLIVIATIWPAMKLGTEFMPELDEGDLLYMPTTLPGISIDTARALLQETDEAIRRMPEVVSVFGKAGRAETATDPAPLEMIETLVRLKPRAEWRPGMDPQTLRTELNSRVTLPGVTGVWLPPIKAREEMSATGTRSELGVGITGPNLAEIERLAISVEDILKRVPGAASVYTERVAGRRYIDIDLDRAMAARYGINVDDVNEIVRYAVGGAVVGETVEGRERYPIIVRYPQYWRDSPEQLRRLPLHANTGQQISLGDVARIQVVEGPAQIRSEDARPVGWIHVSAQSGRLRSYVVEARRRIEENVALPPGYSIRWVGQYEYFERALARLSWSSSLVVLVILALLWIGFRRYADALMVLGTLPIALVGGVWMLWLLGYNMSIAVAVGLIALCGVAAETGIVMLLYLNAAWSARSIARRPTESDLYEAITEGALARLRPKLMTVVAITASLLPVMFGQGSGSEVMRRIAAPIIGGMISATALTLFVIPTLFMLIRGRALRDQNAAGL